MCNTIGRASARRKSNDPRPLAQPARPDRCWRERLAGKQASARPKDQDWGCTGTVGALTSASWPGAAGRWPRCRAVRAWPFGSSNAAADAEGEEIGALLVLAQVKLPLVLLGPARRRRRSASVRRSATWCSADGAPGGGCVMRSVVGITGVVCEVEGFLRSLLVLVRPGAHLQCEGGRAVQNSRTRATSRL